MWERGKQDGWPGDTQDSESDRDARKLVGRTGRDQGVFSPITGKLRQEHGYQLGSQNETLPQKQEKMLQKISIASHCVFGFILPHLSLLFFEVQCHLSLPDTRLILGNRGHDGKKEIAALLCGRVHRLKEELRTERH